MAYDRDPVTGDWLLFTLGQGEKPVEIDLGPLPTGPQPPDRDCWGNQRCPTCDSENPAVREYRSGGGALECERECRDPWHGPRYASQVSVVVAMVVALMAMGLGLAAISMALVVLDAR